jgi:hypothetical protein
MAGLTSKIARAGLDGDRELEPELAECKEKGQGLGLLCDGDKVSVSRPISRYCATCIAGGCHVPAPGGKIEGGSVFGQYNRMTM